MATHTYKLLYQGQLPSSAGTLATVGAAEAWIVRHWTVINNDTVDRTFALFRNGTADANRITPPTVLVKSKGMVESDSVDSFGNNDTLRGVGSVASMLTLTLSGDLVT